MKLITFDIECIGRDTPEIREKIANNIKVPGNYKKPESIEEWKKTELPKIVDEEVLKTSFNGGVGQIISIAWAIDNNEPVVSYGDNEGIVIGDFFESIFECRQMTQFCGHNISGFDIRYIWQRAVVNGIKPPVYYPIYEAPWSNRIADTMLMWSGVNGRVKLSDLCDYLGIDHNKDEIDGSKVWPMYKEGRIKEIAEYNLQDVIKTRECYKRMTFSK